MILKSDSKDCEDFKTLSRRFKGYQNTALLWYGKAIEGIEQFMPDLKTTSTIPLKNRTTRPPLGKYAERFALFQIEQHPELSLIAHNQQVNNNGITLGELDVLINYGNRPIHLELVYKFYLYDPLIKGKNPLAKWIGPNRKDHFLYKIEKLKTKQLPLIKMPECRQLLANIHVNWSEIMQYVIFKGRLFVPFGIETPEDSTLNNEAIVGYYLRFKEIDRLRNFQIHIPSKLDWLAEPYLDVKWTDYESISKVVQNSISSKKSLLLWLKSTNNQLSSSFVVWW